MDFKEIKELIETINNTNIKKIKIKEDNFEIKIVKEDKIASRVREVNDIENIRVVRNIEDTIRNDEEKIESTEDTYIVRSPMVGTFYSAPSPESNSFVEEGSAVKKGEVLCIIEAMKILNEIKSDESGQIEEILVKNEEIVEYNQPLMIIRR